MQSSSAGTYGHAPLKIWLGNYLKNDITRSCNLESISRLYPKASKLEIQILFDAGEKGRVSTAQPGPRAAHPERQRIRGHIGLIDHWPVPSKRSYSSVGALVMPRTMMKLAVEHPQYKLMPEAIALEKRSLMPSHPACQS
jgi:hypothetical protein